MSERPSRAVRCLHIPQRLQPWLLIVAGGLAVGAFAPFNAWPLAFLSLAVLFNQWLGDSPRAAFINGGLFGIGFFGVGASWVYVSIHVYGHVPVFPSALVAMLFVAVLSVFPALAGYLCRRFFAVDSHAGLVLVMPAAWLLTEWVRGWIFTGLPWLDIGASQVAAPFGSYLPVAGEYGVSWLVAVSAALLLSLCAGWRRSSSAILLLMLFAGSVLLARVEWTTPAGESLRVSLVQGNIDQDAKWLPENMQNTLERYIGMTVEEEGVDIVVWPETAIPAFLHQVEGKLLPFLEEVMQEKQATLLTGIPVLEQEDWEYYNSVLSLGGERRLYSKQHLVAFGEYVPLRRYIGFMVDKLVPGNGDFSHGRPDQPLLHAAGYPVGTSICFEAAFARVINRSLPEAALLVNVSNDGWFGRSLAPYQHLEIARVRARETGRSMLRATNTGISAIIDHHGRVVAQSPQFEQYVVRGEIVPRTGATPFVKFGHWPVVVFTVLCLLFARIGKRK